MQYVLFRNLSDIQPVSAPCLHPPAWKVNRPAEGRRVFWSGVSSPFTFGSSFFPDTPFFSAAEIFSATFPGS
jgi:hypothetical protein